MNRLTLNSVPKRRLLVYSSMPNSARIGLGVWVQEAPKFPTSVILAWLCVVTYSSICHHD